MKTYLTRGVLCLATKVKHDGVDERAYVEDAGVFAVAQYARQRRAVSLYEVVVFAEATLRLRKARTDLAPAQKKTLPGEAGTRKCHMFDFCGTQ